MGMFEMTVRSSSTVVSMAKTAFRSGSSKQGKQVLASVAANMVAAPIRVFPVPRSTNGVVKKPSRFRVIWPQNLISSQALK